MFDSETCSFTAQESDCQTVWLLLSDCRAHLWLQVLPSAVTHSKNVLTVIRTISQQAVMFGTPPIAYLWLERGARDEAFLPSCRCPSFWSVSTVLHLSPSQMGLDPKRRRQTRDTPAPPQRPKKRRRLGSSQAPTQTQQKGTQTRTLQLCRSLDLLLVNLQYILNTLPRLCSLISALISFSISLLLF